jgi:hypothetical protein
VVERGDTTLEELRAWLFSVHRVSASVGLIWHTLRLLGLTLKKSRFVPPSRIGRMSPRLVPNGVRTSQLETGKLIFIDETWTKTNMVRLYGWAEVNFSQPQVRRSHSLLRQDLSGLARRGVRGLRRLARKLNTRSDPKPAEETI